MTVRGEIWGGWSWFEVTGVGNGRQTFMDGFPEALSVQLKLETMI